MILIYQRIGIITFFMISLKLCEKCGYRHGHGRCCIDIYQQIGQTKGPSVIGKVILAFVLPILVFIICLIGVEHLLDGLTTGGITIILSFLISLSATIIFVQLIRIFSRKPVKINKVEGHNELQRPQTKR